WRSATPSGANNAGWGPRVRAPIRLPPFGRLLRAGSGPTWFVLVPFPGGNSRSFDSGNRFASEPASSAQDDRLCCTTERHGLKPCPVTTPVSRCHLIEN